MLGEPPSEDDLALDVAESRVAAKLFGSSTASSVAIGRYKLLELVGRGGMGVVWGAWDPELERRVAIKLVGGSDDSPGRILDEARALAKLSHPNVVPIYDVGVVDERVYLVMEWVEGDNLRAHLREPRRVRDIVDCYLQAARGLAAIHAAGLVHRDVKPDNAVIGPDGRVRVLDFGLARRDATTSVPAGTRAYMPPEQVAGDPATPAVDQFALCVSLREAFADRELPRWIETVIVRGTSTDPGSRFPSMAALVGALEHDPVRTWRRRIILAGALAASLTAFIVGRAASTTDTAEPCSSPPAITIDDATRTRVAQHLDGLGGFAAAQRAPVLALLDDHDHQRIAAQQESCLSHDRGELPIAMYERRLTCLARSRESLTTVADILEHASVDTFPAARLAVSELVDARRCSEVDQSLIASPAAAILPATRTADAAIERARLLAAAARPDATAEAVRARELAEATGHAPLIARALLVEGRARMAVEDKQARPTLERAMRAAFAAHDDATAVEAFARSVFVAVRFDGVFTVDGTSVMQALALRLSPNEVFARLLLYNNLAIAHQAAGDRAGARTVLESAMSEWSRAKTTDDFELVSIPQNLALAVDDGSVSVALLEQAHARASSILGVDHPKVIEIERFQAMFHDLDRARTTLDGACTRLRTMLPHLVDERADCEYDAGWLADEAGDREAARMHFMAVAAGHIEPLRAVAAAAMATSPSRNAAVALEHTADTARAKADNPWAKVLVGDVYAAAARAFEGIGDDAGRHRCWEAVRQVFTSVPIPYTARRLARARTALAR